MTQIDMELYKQIGRPRDCFSAFENTQSILLYGDSKSGDPRLSFVIPTFCREDKLREAIDSILRQPPSIEYEIVIVDNSAITDDSNPTLQLVREIASPRILLYVNEKNIGMINNWNRAILLARSNYVAMLHDDDLLSENYMDDMCVCIKLIERKKKRLGAVLPRTMDYHEGDLLPDCRQKDGGGLYRYTRWNTLMNGFGPTSCPSCGMLFNREAVIKTGGFDERFYPAADYILGQQLQEAGYGIYRTKNVVGYYRIGINESMKKEVLLNFGKCDYFFREYLYSKTVCGRLFGRFFRKAQYMISLEQMCNLGKRFGQDISEKEVDFAGGYGTCQVRVRLLKALARIGDYVIRKCPV